MNFRQPPKSPPEPAGANEPALQQAIFALGKGQLKEAELLAADFLKRNPTDPRVLQIFGSALLLQGEAERAIAPLSQAARRTHDPAIEMQAAMAMSKAGHSESALEWLERATKRRPAFPPAFHVYGTMLASLDRLDEAIDVTRHGLALMPDVAELSILLGDLLANRGDHVGARAAYTEALARAPQQVDALWGLARAYESLGEFTQATKAFRCMLAIAPHEHAARVGLGICLLEIGQPEEALELFRAAGRSGDKMYGECLMALAKASRGRFWLRPTAAKQVLRESH
jgi:tetratricopeptide (TPR) repeat protein